MSRAAAVAAGCYGGYVAATWLTYGRGRRASTDALLDRFLPDYDVAERHEAFVRAPAAVALRVAMECDLRASWTAQTLIHARELLLGSLPKVPGDERLGFLAEMQTLGWRVLAEVPDREVVVGAVTQPWHARVVFRPLAPPDFVAFSEPDFTKIAWTLRADPVDVHSCIVRTETRVATTDAEARRKFRLYWSLLSPGILLIRRALLWRVKRDAESLAGVSLRYS